MNNRLRLAAAALGVAFVLAIALGATGVLTPKNQRTALGASTTLAIISGDVQVRHGTGNYTAADDGMVLAPGDSVRTGADARAVLTYFEGSTVEIEPMSELAIEVAHGNPDGSTVIEMRQQLGTTWHVVTHLVQGGSKYDVHTTASTASVRGTQFIVGVDAEQTTSVATTEGNVATSDTAATTTVAVTPGLITTTKNGQKPTPPQPAPEPERKVTVTVGDQNTLVVDAFGRANGVKDGKTIIQTPGAQVKVVDGKTIVTLPNIPDGDLATHFLNTSKSDDVEVTTKVEEKGKAPVQVTEKVKPSDNAVTGVELHKTGSTGASGATGSTDTGDSTPSLKLKKITETKPIKVSEAPKTPTEDEQKKAAEQNSNTDQNDSGKTPSPTRNTSSNDNTTTGGRTGILATPATRTPAPDISSDAAEKAKDAQAAEPAKQKQDAEKTEPTATPASRFFNPGGGIIPITPVTGGSSTSGTTSGDNERTKPVTERPATEKAATEKPATERPSTERPSTERPATEKPATKTETPEKTPAPRLNVIPQIKVPTAPKNNNSKEGD